MIRTIATISTSVRVAGAFPPHLIVKLRAENEDWTMEGNLSFTGLGSKSIDRIEDELVRRLHGRCTLSISSVESFITMKPHEFGRNLAAFCKDWGLTADDMARKSGLNRITVEKCLNGGGKIRRHTQQAIASTIDRIDQHPTVGEYLRRRRIEAGYHDKQAARYLGVSEDVLLEWEQDKEEVPPKKRWYLMNMYGISEDVWSKTTSTVLDIMAPVTGTSPPPWGTWTEGNEDGEKKKSS